MSPLNRAGGAVGVFVIEAGLFELGRSPIVNGIFELIKMGEMAVKLRSLTGRFTSKRFAYAPPTGTRPPIKVFEGRLREDDICC